MSATPNPHSPPSPSRPYFIAKSTDPNRSFKQFSLFCAGGALLTVSSLITHRSLLRRHNLMQPRWFQDSTLHKPTINGAFEAAEALGLATLNVISVSALIASGTAWAMDLSSVEEVKARLRRKMVGAHGVEGDEERLVEGDREIEEWFTGKVLAKKGWWEMAEELAKGPPGEVDDIPKKV